MTTKRIEVESGQWGEAERLAYKYLDRADDDAFAEVYFRDRHGVHLAYRVGNPDSKFPETAPRPAPKKRMARRAQEAPASVMESPPDPSPAPAAPAAPLANEPEPMKQPNPWTADL